MSGLATLLSVASCLMAPPAGAHAPTVCPSASSRPEPSGPASVQQRYDQGTLNRLADGHGVTIAVIDSGVDSGHPQLRGAVEPGPDHLDGGLSRLDCVGHGTAVAGIIAARPMDGVAFRGLAPAATILALRVSELVELENGATAGRRGTAADLAAAIREAVERGARVINLSLVSYRDDPAVRAAVAFAVAHDVVLVAAAGNRYAEGNPVPYPAAYDGVIGVGAVDESGKRLPSSQAGDYVDLVAPGAGIVSTVPPAGLRAGDGTSFATPFVSATAALLLQYRPELTAREVAEQLRATADGGWGEGYGAGRLNPLRALTEVSGPGTRSPPVAGPAARPAAGVGPPGPFRLAGALLAATLLLVAAVIALPRARRRRWRPGVQRAPGKS
ncbi:type VII secretion-associated serine protease mycosin [Dactylosporangium sp. AC04546]|uniref:type VII secretion-associated serine protease mycosin n=1 Tax=Dactylosporangium sp. AC04546 TaxID=2862460 RepID=UPI002102A30A|nr:type VII secretion-associated serine protease mycosin [Dactylosporangium sp. AC04546]WVK89423.1 type VII secretion-associated serine protease mycosin [Dactylosporangium sp. AC04546]